MANTYPTAIVSITCPDINGNSILKVFNEVRHISYDFIKSTVNIVDATGSFYFGYSTMITVTQVIANGVTTITIS